MIKLLENKKHYFLFGLLFFFLFAHYHGYILDAALYLLQVVNHLHPERFVNDVPFMFGNQDSFSLFSPVISQIFKVLGVNLGGTVATLVLELFWCIAALFLVDRWSEHFGMRKWALPIFCVFVVVFAFQTYACGGGEFPVIDTLLVARFLSEIFALFALAFLFSKNRYASLVLFLVATSIHPLMCGWGIPLWLFFHFPKTRLPIVVASALFPLTAFLHIDRFDFYGDDWITKPYVFTPNWEDSLNYLGYLFFWLSMYKGIGKPGIRKFSLAMFWVVLIGFYFQYIASFTGHIFLFQVQPYRIQWFCIMPVLPVFALFAHEKIRGEAKLCVRDYAIFFLSLCAIAQRQYVLVLLVLVALIFIPNKFEIKWSVKQKWFNLIFVVTFIFLLAKITLFNYIEMGIQQGFGDVQMAISLMTLPDKLAPMAMLLVLLLTIVAFVQKRYWVALALGLSYCNAHFTVLPLMAIVFYLIPNMTVKGRRVLLALTGALSFAEILSSVQGTPVMSVLFIAELFILTLLFLRFKNCNSKKVAALLLSVTATSFAAWDVYKWDARDLFAKENERQMDAFFEQPIFPQVVDRGKILFVVDGEGPLQSRFNFLTGAYGDESIYVGEIFYKGQFQESNRRRTALLTGDTVKVHLGNYSTRISKVYADLDTLTSRIDYLCGVGDIGHVATDYGNIPLTKIDSTYLDIKKKYVYLYKCGKN